MSEFPQLRCQPWTHWTRAGTASPESRQREQNVVTVTHNLQECKHRLKVPSSPASRTTLKVLKMKETTSLVVLERALFTCNLRRRKQWHYRSAPATYNGLHAWTPTDMCATSGRTVFSIPKTPSPATNHRKDLKMELPNSMAPKVVRTGSPIQVLHASKSCANNTSCCSDCAQ